VYIYAFIFYLFMENLTPMPAITNVTY